MPGPGPHMIYALGSGQGLMYVSNGRFGPHHCVIYAINAFFGPDIGSFSEWLSSFLGSGRILGSSVEQWIHDPFYYALILGFPLSLLYSWVSRFLLHKNVLDSFSGVSWRVKPLKSVRRQYHKSMRLTLVVGIAYCLWCACQIYLVRPRRPAVGEEADLGVLVFLGIFFFFPHWLCILSMNPREIAEQLPL